MELDEAVNMTTIERMPGVLADRVREVLSERSPVAYAYYNDERQEVLIHDLNDDGTEVLVHVHYYAETGKTHTSHRELDVFGWESDYPAYEGDDDDA